jgi:hypothetical protein
VAEKRDSGQARMTTSGKNKRTVIPACRPDASGFFKTYGATRN